MEWIAANWQWIALALFVADKIVAVTPTKYDDLIFTAIKGALTGIKKKPKIEIPLVIFAGMFMVGCLAGPAAAFQPEDWVRQSGIKTSSQTAVSGAGYLYGIMVSTDGTNDVTVVSYDNTAATGTKLHPDWVVTTSASNRAQVLGFDPPVAFNNGVYVSVTTGGTVSYAVYYRAR